MVKELCLRCKRPIYPLDRVGPLKDSTLFHHGCFKCYICGTRLALKSYCHNRNDIGDQEVYCNNHVPQANPHEPVPHHSNLATTNNGVGSSVVNGHGSAAETAGGHVHKDDQEAASDGSSHNKPVIGDMHIQHALKATEIRKPYPKIVHPGAKYTLDYDQQTRLELVHREEEDDLYITFSKQREEEEKRFANETKQEWEQALSEFARRYEKASQLASGVGGNNNNNNEKVSKDREDLIRQLTLKRDKRQQTMRSVMKEKERTMTADLVEKQSREMMDLFKTARQQEVKNGVSQDKPNAGGHFKNITSTTTTTSSTMFYKSGAHSPSASGDKNDSGSLSPNVSHTPYPASPPPPSPPKYRTYKMNSEYFSSIDQTAISIAQSELSTFTELIRALTFNCRNDVEVARAIYRWITVKNLNTMEFDHRTDADTPMGLLRGIKYGTESYHVLFKRLCSYAGLHCVVIKGFSKSAGYQPGVPFNDHRFRNTWNAVFLEDSWRFVQCNWGARHLVNARGDSTNAAVSESPSGGAKSFFVASDSGSENLRYEYDDHYFMTDPEQFVYEFFPNQPDWQLLRKPLTLTEFENLPFVRSLFFRYGLQFSQMMTGSPVLSQNQPNFNHIPPAVINADDTGSATVALNVPEAAFPPGSPARDDKRRLLIFHYSLKFYDSDAPKNDSYHGVNLKRFVMQSCVGDNGLTVVFRVHVPCANDYLLDVFANDSTLCQYLTGRPMKFKSVCKFKLVCRRLPNVVMVPLPECAGGEWGPHKARRLFAMHPLTHVEAIVNHFSVRPADLLVVQFRLERPLAEFVTALKRNDTVSAGGAREAVSEKKLAKLVQQSVTDNGRLLTLKVHFVDDGQYGLDVYTREAGGGRQNGHGGGSAVTCDQNLLTHCCKYLINVRFQAV